MNSTSIKSTVAKLAMIAVLGVMANVAQASSYTVQVGYADNLRPSPFFPNPWFGDAGVSTFAGSTSGGIDSAAIRIINTGSSSIVFGGMTVDSFGDGASFTLWNSWIGTTILAGDSMILTQTTQYNFDASDDQGSNPLAIPRVVLNIDGLTGNYFDTAQVLNTEGTDYLAQHGFNESHQWREIGTFGGQSGDVPDSGSTLALLGLGIAGLAGLRRRSAKV